VAAPENPDDSLIFAFHRMKEAIVLPENSRAPDGFDIDEYIASGAFGWGDGERIELEAIFEAGAAEHLQETRLAEDQKLSPLPDQRMKIQATVNDTPQLEWWLLGFGDAVEVIRPEGLRARREQTARGMTRLYAGGIIYDNVQPAGRLRDSLQLPRRRTHVNAGWLSLPRDAVCRSGMRPYRPHWKMERVSALRLAIG
jgi:hypothetical protein